MSNRVIKNSQPIDPQSERRKAERRPILESFSLFVSVPKKNVLRLPIHDLSELGIGFDLDAEGENPSDFPVKVGETLDIEIYLNQSLHIPLTIKVARIEGSEKTRKVGGEYADRSSKGFAALQAFIKMLDCVIGVGHLEAKK